MPPPHEQARGVKTTLVSMTGEFITGDLMDENSHEHMVYPITYRGNSIALLISFTPDDQPSVIVESFLERQQTSILIIGAVSLSLCFLLALVVVPKMLAPFNTIANAIKQLSTGQYHQYTQLDNKDEFGVLMQQVNQLAATLESNEAMKKQWIADIAHELRTPLTVLSGELELIKLGVRQTTPEQIESFNQEVQRLSRLVEDLYQLSLDDMGQLSFHFANVDLAKIVNEQIRVGLVLAQAKGIEIDASHVTSVWISADTQRLSQLVMNLVVNSVSYTDAPGNMRIAVSQDDKFGIFSIEDTPPGVSREAQRLIFEPLYREDKARTSRQNGAGLGLSICQRIIKGHKGEMHVSSSELGGLCIEVKLPKQREQHV
ncbi:hypothetical protein KUL49_34120 [Alteromonas sp. KUL49]|nr:hypothetical protein KUL49_34120 [Alteromonas sp. KUL49]